MKIAKITPPLIGKEVTIMADKLSVQTKAKLDAALDAYKNKAAFEMYAELYKCGVLSRQDFIKYARQYVLFVPSDPE